MLLLLFVCQKALVIPVESYEMNKGGMRCLTILRLLLHIPLWCVLSCCLQDIIAPVNLLQMYAIMLKVPSFSEKKRPLPRKIRVKVALLCQISGCTAIL